MLAMSSTMCSSDTDFSVVSGENLSEWWKWWVLVHGHHVVHFLFSWMSCPVDHVSPSSIALTNTFLPLFYPESAAHAGELLSTRIGWFQVVEPLSLLGPRITTCPVYLRRTCGLTGLRRLKAPTSRTICIGEQHGADSSRGLLSQCTYK